LEIEIEERSADEVTHISGRLADGRVARVALAPPGTRAANPAFDVTPAELIEALITDRGLCPATKPALAAVSGRGKDWAGRSSRSTWRERRRRHPARPPGCRTGRRRGCAWRRR